MKKGDDSRPFVPIKSGSELKSGLGSGLESGSGLGSRLGVSTGAKGIEPPTASELELTADDVEELKQWINEVRVRVKVRVRMNKMRMVDCIISYLQ
jgi:hypothetical protein